MRLSSCPSCKKHFFVSEQQCPYCKATRTPSHTSSRGNIALLMGFALSACAGGEDGDKDTNTTTSTTTETDTNTDGFDSGVAPLYGVVDTGEYDTGDDTGYYYDQPEYGIPYIDEDQDGYYDYEDCNDLDPYTHPGAAENEADPTACMTDADGDGFGDTTPATSLIAPGTDCDDDNPDIHPNASETTGDSVDSNCNGDNDQ